MLKLSNYYALRSLKCLHLAATVLWCGGSIAAMLLTYTVGLTSNIENVLHMYLIRPGIWALIATGVIYTVCTNFSCKQRWKYEILHCIQMLRYSTQYRLTNV